MKYITKEIVKKLPPLYSQENNPDPIVYAKFFSPFNGWTWYAYEFDGEDVFFGWVDGEEQEFGYFSLSEFKQAEKVFPDGGVLKMVERDAWFTPKPLSECMALHKR